MKGGKNNFGFTSNIAQLLINLESLIPFKENI